MRVTALCLMLVVGGIAPAAAQPPPPKRLPPAVFDLRGLTASLGTDSKTATDLNISAAELPSRGVGGVAAIHVYPYRRPGFAIGLGGEGLLARARLLGTTSTGAPSGLLVERRMQSLSGAVSFNFGGRNGWSYVTAGLGPFRFESFTGGLPPTLAPVFRMTQNFGGGARWFARDHIAFCFDVRFYLTRPQETTAINAGANRKRMLLISAGISVK
jgi:hypothetical protein